MTSGPRPVRLDGAAGLRGGAAGGGCAPPNSVLRGFALVCAARPCCARLCAALRARGSRWQQIFTARAEAQPRPFAPLSGPGGASAVPPAEGVLTQAMSRDPAALAPPGWWQPGK